MKKRKNSSGQILLDAVVAMTILMFTVTGGLYAITAAYCELSWNSMSSLADAYLDREAAVLRRLSPAELQARGYHAGEVSTSLAVPLNYKRSGESFVPDVYTAQRVMRRATDLGKGAFTFQVELMFQTKGSHPRLYSKTRTVTRNFSTD